jgi:hypothetical protein
VCCHARTSLILQAAIPRTKEKFVIREQTVRALRASALFIPTLGLTWLFAFLSMLAPTDTIGYVFAIFNGLQGVVLFLVHVVWNKDVRDAFVKRIARGKSSHYLSSDVRKPQRPTKVSVLQSSEDSRQPRATHFFPLGPPSVDFSSSRPVPDGPIMPSRKPTAWSKSGTTRIGLFNGLEFGLPEIYEHERPVSPSELVSVNVISSSQQA